MLADFAGIDPPALLRPSTGRRGLKLDSDILNVRRFFQDCKRLKQKEINTLNVLSSYWGAGRRTVTTPITWTYRALAETRTKMRQIVSAARPGAYSRRRRLFE